MEAVVIIKAEPMGSHKTDVINNMGRENTHMNIITAIMKNTLNIGFEWFRVFYIFGQTKSRQMGRIQRLY